MSTETYTGEDAVGAIRLALDSAENDRAAVAVITSIVAMIGGSEGGSSADLLTAAMHQAGAKFVVTAPGQKGGSDVD